MVWKQIRDEVVVTRRKWKDFDQDRSSLTYPAETPHSNVSLIGSPLRGNVYLRGMRHGKVEALTSP